MPARGRKRVTEGTTAPAPVGFPHVGLPLAPPYPPMEARTEPELPRGDWVYEPKWDGFRCVAFRDGDTIVLQSKAGQPLARYFPEVVAALGRVRAPRFVLDGEIVVAVDGRLAFDELLQRIHPAASRIARLSAERPATYLVFDLLVDGRGTSVAGRPLRDRRAALERFAATFPADGGVRLSPCTTDRALAERWMTSLASTGFDGVVAKEAGAAYRSGERTAMVKVKRAKTADCVVGGFRWAQRGGVGSLLLGLYDDDGLLHHVGFTSSFTDAERQALRDVLEPHVGEPAFTGSAPGGPSRWSSGRSTEWVALRPELVCEVKYDHFASRRFRHGTTFLRWRPDKRPAACTFEQVESSAPRIDLERLAPPARRG
jgi:ATP-dependent DNA ligase